jgi:hypothetical protein
MDDIAYAMARRFVDAVYSPFLQRLGLQELVVGGLDTWTKVLVGDLRCRHGDLPSARSGDLLGNG